MARAELLADFVSRVDKFDKLQSFITKAQSQAGKFAAAVIEKVVKDNEEKSMEVVGEIIPLLSDLEAVIGELDGERETATDNAKDCKFRLEELELRQMIGDITDEAFEAESAKDTAVVKSTDEKVTEIDEVLGQYRAAIDRWQVLGTAAGILSDVVPELEALEEEIIIDDDILVEDEIEADDGDDVFQDDDTGGAHVERVSIAEDMSDVLADVEGEDFEVGDLDILGDDEDIELEAGSDDDEDEKASDDKPRRAVLLYQEGTAEEQIYPFTGDVMSLGRGRDNDVQVKNDSKVSRYHCKLYRRGPNFYVEDNKSANGSLVNGELITERRLFGGEEVIIGETFFRFRILD